MIEIQVQSGLIGEALAELQARMANLQPAMETIGATLENRVRDRRETGRDPEGNSWEAWSANYLANYDYRRPGEDPPRGKMLDRTGAMWDKTGLEWKDATATSVRVGFDKGYSTWHELGTKTMPRRGLLFADPEKGELGAEDERAVVELLEDWLNGAI